MSAFVIGRVGDRFGHFLIGRMACLCYAVGLALRIDDHNVVAAVVSGALAGLGASAVLISLRVWMLTAIAEEQRPKFLSVREVATQSGVALGTGVAGTLVLILGSGNGGYVRTLLAAAVLAALAAVALPTPPAGRPRPGAPHEDSARLTLRMLFSRHRWLTLGVTGLGILLGLYTSMLAPYLPVILRSSGVPLSLVGPVLAVAAVARIATAAATSPFLRRLPPTAVFAVAEAGCALATGLLGWGFGPWLAAAAVLVRSVMLVASTLSEELIELKIFPKANAATFFGLAQTSFLIGDAAGGGIGGALYSAYGLRPAIVAAAILTLLNAALFPIFYRTFMRRSVVPEETVAQVDV
jgi:predicted MFS family arabinose efflux permease